MSSLLPMHRLPVIIDLPSTPGWMHVAHHGSWIDVVGRCCRVSLEPRPTWCDRGHFVAKLDAGPELHIDGHDGWPRYYLDFDRAMAEVIAWITDREARVG